MRLAVMSDVHANEHALNIVLNDAKSKSVDKYVFLGDYITDGGASNKILEVIRNIGDYVIIGNREKYIISYDNKRDEFNNSKTLKYVFDELTNENFEYIKSLEDNMTFVFDETKFLITHGDEFWTSENEIFIFFDKLIAKYDFDICFFGHIHLYLDTIYKGKRFICPGSVGQSVDSPTYKYCIMSIDSHFKNELCEIAVSDTFERFKNEYMESEFYNLNKIWGELIIKSVQDGVDYIRKFMAIVNERTNDDMNASEYNRIYEKVYKEYMSNNFRQKNLH